MNIQLSDHFDCKKLIRFTAPTIVMMIFTSIYGIVDGLFVSNFVGSQSFAAVNLIMPVLIILGSIGFMIGTGGSAVVSVTLGEGNIKRANQYFTMLVGIIVIVGIIISAVGFFLIRPAAILLGAQGEILADCIIYGRVLILAITPFLLQNCFQSFLVAAERPKLGLIISIISGVSNMVLDFLFIYVLKAGVFGAAMATAISQAAGSVLPIVFFSVSKKSKLRFTKTKLMPNIIIKACTNGSSEMVTNLSMSLVSMLYNMQLMKYAGYSGVVAYGIIMYTGFIFSGTYVGYSLGVAPVIGYHFGAENYDELKGLFKRSLKLLTITAAVMTLLAELLSKYLAGIFVGYDADLLNMTTTAIRIFSISYIISEINIFASSFFTALNNGLVSAVISFVRTFLFQVVMIFALPLFLGLNGIWFAITGAELLSLIVSTAFLIINRKKYNYA